MAHCQLKDSRAAIRTQPWLNNPIDAGQKLITESDDEELKQKFADLDCKIGLETIKRLEHFAQSLGFQAGSSVPVGAKAVTIYTDCECDCS